MPVGNVERKRPPLRVELDGKMWTTDGEGEWVGRDKFGQWFYNPSPDFQFALDRIWELEFAVRDYPEMLNANMADMIMYAHRIIDMVEVITKRLEVIHEG